MQTKEDFFTLVRDHATELRSLGVRRCGLFGSFVRGEQNSESDVDVLLEFEAGQKSFDHFFETAFLLEDLCQRHVDVVTAEGLSPYIGPKILREVEYVTLTS